MQPPNLPASDANNRKPSLKDRLRRLPVVGAVLSWVYAIVRINPNRRHILLDLAELRDLLQTHHVQVSERLNRYDALGLEGMQIGQRLERLESADSMTRLGALEKSLASLHAASVQQETRITALTQELRRTPQVAPVQVATRPLADPVATTFDLDSFYVEFEGLFRGSREDIQGRLKVYLPQVARLAGNPDARVVDVGCGRGEWLELLSQQGIKAVGIDLNSDMVGECRSRGLQAECADAVAWLRQQPEGSLAAVTGFHIIEHLPFETMIALFDAALHALCDEGFIIFETPNPENVLVGSCNFYYDPTHRHPLVPVVMEFMARQRGFAHAEILRLHPFPEEMQVAEDTEAARRINKLFYGPQDFAVLAWKSKPAVQAK